ncbi:MAG: rhodanese-like domain-containing protein [Acidobacteriota bacterium]|nr:rhodanese-like domain-containing protein [Acidobacteriota bacterium]
MKLEVRLAGKRLAAAVIVLLAAALALAATMAKGSSAGPVNASAIAGVVNSEQDHVTPGEMARWIVEKRKDYQLIDIRSAWEFDDYHIPTAINIPLAQLFEDSGLKQLSRDKKIVLYGFGAGHAAQAQLLLSMKGYQAFSLRDGISDWWENVMSPKSIRSDPPDPNGYRAAKQLREQFMGTGGTPGPAGAAPAAVPAPPAPGQTPKDIPPASKLKLGKGCS